MTALSIPVVSGLAGCSKKGTVEGAKKVAAPQTEMPKTEVRNESQIPKTR